MCVYKFSVVLWLSCLPLDPRFAGSNTAEDDGFLRAIKIRSTTSSRGGGGVQPSAPRRKILQHLKDSAEYDRDTSPVKLTDFSPYRHNLLLYLLPQ
jgi:hypothetical protein